MDVERARIARDKVKARYDLILTHYPQCPCLPTLRTHLKRWQVLIALAELQELEKAELLANSPGASTSEDA